MSDLTTKKVLQLRCNNEIGYSLCSLRRPSRCSCKKKDGIGQLGLWD